MTWQPTRGVTSFRAELDKVFPGRDRASDGIVGDLAHQTGQSGHNPDLTGKAEYKDGDALDEVRATDIDRDLVPGSAIDWMERVVQFIVILARAGAYVPFRYMIYKGRIWSRSTGWETREYSGANKHDKHAHFSGDYTQRADEWAGRLGLSVLRGEEQVADNGWSTEVEHGDGRKVANQVAVQNVAEVLRRGAWTDWWITGILKRVDANVATLVTDQSKLTSEVRSVAALVNARIDALSTEVASVRAVLERGVEFDYPALAKALLDEMARRAEEGQSS